MNNAKYHRHEVQDKGNAGTKKDDDSDDESGHRTLSTLKREQLIERLCSLNLPPYYSGINQIEEGWGITKDHVGRVNDGSDFALVKDYIHDGFDKADIKSRK
ncbi:hypothetical protein BG011_002821 [Mortierella polycephala]|uniref:Uncharacterized protein n=1 Tax=Mortierella polycephala TaxID=41804 RepID=A0A9P6TT67_9FUNG|nr:hypothetical protein BG011_002821 [Mortierella polycephala]